MHDQPRRFLHDLVRAHGSGLCEDISRCRRLLEQQRGTFPAEVNSLLAAQEQGVARELRALPARPGGDWAEPLVRRVVRQGELGEETARWAVYSWAAALNKLQEVPYVPLESLRKPARRDPAARNDAAHVGGFFGALVGLGLGAAVAWVEHPNLFIPGWLQWTALGAAAGLVLGALAGWLLGGRRR